MNTKEITKIISDEDLSSVRNVFYGSKWINNNDGEDNKLSKSYLNISEKCNTLNYAADGIIGINDDDYGIYEQSQFYQGNNDSRKLNAFLWYYSTGRLDDAVTRSGTTVDSNVLNQMKNTACQILQKKAVSIDYSNTETSKCDNTKIIGCSIKDILSNNSTNKVILISIFIISSILFVFGIISLINLAFKILKSYNKLNNVPILQNIIISILVFIGVAVGLIYFYKYSISNTSTALSNEYVFIPPSSPPSSTTTTTTTTEVDMIGQDSSSSSTNYGCQNTINGCCDPNNPNNNVAKIDENGSNCVQQTDSNVDLSIIVWFVVLFIMSLIFYILFIVFENKILFWCFIICCVLSLNFIFGNIKMSETVNLVVQKQINTNINILMNTSNFINKYIGQIIGVSISSIIIFLFISKFLFNKIGLIFNIFDVISKTLLSLSFVIIIFSIFIIWYNYPLIFAIIVFAWRFLVSNILSFSTSNPFNLYTFETPNDFIINLNSFLYEQPLQYFINLYDNHMNKDTRTFKNYFTGDINLKKEPLGNIDLPSGLPWDFPVITIIKICLLFIIKNYTEKKNKKDENIFNIFDITENKYAASNVNVFSIFSFFGNMFKK